MDLLLIYLGSRKMPSVKNSPNFRKIIAALRRRVTQGDESAMCDLGMWLQEGSQDRKGRSILRSNPTYAFRLLKAAAERGYKEAADSLGYAV
jgi:TPR repeat protein